MEGIDLDQLMTQENDCEILTNKRPTKAPKKKRALRCTVDFVHLSSLANCYNHRFMFYSQNKKMSHNLYLTMFGKLFMEITN